MGVKRATVARWEGKSQTPVSSSADRLLRLFCGMEIFGEDSIPQVWEAIEEIDDSVTIKKLSLAYVPAQADSELPGVIDHKNQGWRTQEAA